LKVQPEFGARYDGQVATIVAANLLARMTPALAFDVTDTELVPPLPWAGMKLKNVVQEVAFGADSGGHFEMREGREGDYPLFLGRGRSRATVHGSGWNAFIGPMASPLPDSIQPNPFGPAMAAILAAARLFALDMAPMDGPHLANAFNWKSCIVSDNVVPAFHPGGELGSIWSVGLGSVGTAVLYFITLTTREFSSTLFDMDDVRVQNLDRSPIFLESDAQGDRQKKVDVTERYLRSTGVRNVTTEAHALDESQIWSAREAGTPDLVVSAANERNVRYIVEQSGPPLQIYGTTGANWEASVIRHIPMVDACSCCLFPPDNSKAAMTCAGDHTVEKATGRSVDASLPFLSFAAGLMAAAEILKASLATFQPSPNRTTLYTHPSGRLRFLSLPVRRRADCLCSYRSTPVHQRMINGTRYEGLSTRRDPPARQRAT
jgi:molybdopterin/thiamine biosynthesis adenylyltransferase